MCNLSLYFQNVHEHTRSHEKDKLKWIDKINILRQAIINGINAAIVNHRQNQATTQITEQLCDKLKAINRRTALEMEINRALGK